jgi:hypothetical protein
MAINACDICDCIPQNVDERFYNQAALNLLCEIVTNTGASGPAENVNVLDVIPGVAATNLGKAEDALHTSGDVGVMALAVRNDSSTTLTTTTLDYSPMAVNSLGALMCSLNVNYQMGASGGSSPVVSEDASVSDGAALMLVGARRIDTPGTNPGANGDAGFVNQSSLGNIWVTPTPSVGGGASMFLNAALTNTAVVVKGSAGTLMSVEIFNPSAAVTYIQIFNVAAASVTLGTTVPNKSIGVGIGQSLTIPFPMGLAFGTAISCAATTTATGNTAPATAAVVNIDYM